MHCKIKFILLKIIIYKKLGEKEIFIWYICTLFKKKFDQMHRMNNVISLYQTFELNIKLFSYLNILKKLILSKI